MSVGVASTLSLDAWRNATVVDVTLRQMNVTASRRMGGLPAQIARRIIEHCKRTCAHDVDRNPSDEHYHLLFEYEPVRDA